MPIEIQRDGSRTRVIVIGSADLTLSSAFKAALLDAFSSSPGIVEIDLSQITELNVNCLQLVWAAKREAASLGIPLIILQPREPQVMEPLRDASLRLPTDVAAESPSETYA